MDKEKYKDGESYEKVIPDNECLWLKGYFIKKTITIHSLSKFNNRIF